LQKINFFLATPFYKILKQKFKNFKGIKEFFFLKNFFF